MKRILLALILSCASALHAAEPVNLAGDKARAAEVWTTFERWLVAYAKGDLATVMAIFDPQVRFTFQGVDDQGLKELQAGYVDDFKGRGTGTVWAPKVEEVYADGNMAIVRATWEQRVTLPDRNVVIRERNRSMDVLRRTSDGKWVIFRSMNYPERR